MSEIPELQQAVRRIPGVATAVVRWPDPRGPASLRILFGDEADREQVTAAVLRTLREAGSVDLERLALVGGGRTNRPVFGGLRIAPGELDTSVEVTLTLDNRNVTGTAHGLSTRRAVPRTAANAALAALHQLLPDHVRVQLDWLEVIEAERGRMQVVQSGVICLTRDGEEEVHVGTAIVRTDVRDAAVRATLDAMNRRVGLLLAA